MKKLVSKYCKGFYIGILSMLVFTFSAILTSFVIGDYNHNPVIIDNKDFVRQELNITVHIFDNSDNLNKAIFPYTGSNLGLRDGFSVWSLSEPICDIFVTEPKNENDVNTWGHEMMHCVFGDWHVSKF